MPIFTQPVHEAERPLVETNQKELAKKYGIEHFDFPHPQSQIRHIGLNPKTGTWYGWSHRAIAGFKVGDVVKKGDVIAAGVMNSPPLRGQKVFPVGFRARTLQDARDMAASFAEFVS